MYYGSVIQVFGLLSSNLAGNTKKTTVTSLIFTVSAAGSLGAPFAFKGSEAPEGYPSGMIPLFVLTVAAEVAFLVLLYVFAPLFPHYFLSLSRCLSLLIDILSWPSSPFENLSPFIEQF